MSELGDAIREALPDIYSESECIDGCHFFLVAVPYGTAAEAHEALGELLAEVERLRLGLWDCAIRAGFDNDGDETPAALSYPDIVELALREVQQLRSDYKEATQ